MICVFCPAEGSVRKRDMNGLPAHVPACPACVQAVKDRQAGVIVRPDGTLHVTPRNGDAHGEAR